MKLFYGIVSILLLVMHLNASTLEKVSLQLHWKYQFEFAGFLVAQEKGFYKDVGLDVNLKRCHLERVDMSCLKIKLQSFIYFLVTLLVNS